MLAKWLRKWFGSVRLALTLFSLFLGFVVVSMDMLLKLRLTPQLYAYLSTIAGTVAVFVWKDTDRAAGYSIRGYQYESEQEGAP